MSTVKVNTIDKRSGSTLTLGGSGTAVTLACGATQTGFGRTGTVDWQTASIKTSTFTAASGEGYFANTSGGAFNMNLPAGSAGAIVSVADYANTWQTNNLTVVPNGSDKIGSVSANVSLSTQGQSVTLVFVDSTQGWINTMDSTSNVRAAAFISASGGTETTSGDFKIHTFTSSGTFTVNNVGIPSGSTTVNYLVIAGGGSGGSDLGGGGGAGGFRTVFPAPATGGLAVTATSFPITVGAGGNPASTPAPSGPSKGGLGSNSIFSSITSAGGGGGGGGPVPQGAVALAGGSGGGNGGYAVPGNGPGGAGNTPPVSPPQGNPGGTGNGNGDAYPGAGGGGSNAAGATSPGIGQGGQVGGAGTPNTIDTNSFSWAGGGGGGAYSPGLAAGNGGVGGGGGGGKDNNPPGSGPATVGTGGAGLNPGANGLSGPENTGGPPSSGGAGGANTGGGGGGSGHGGTAGSQPVNVGGAGGSGIVIIRYKFQ